MNTASKEYLELIDSIKMSYTLIGKSKETVGNEYRVTLSRNKKRMTFTFHTNLYDEIENVSDIIDCLCSDKGAFDSLYPNYWTVDWFRREFGYSEDDKSDKELREIMRQTKRNAEGLARLFPNTDLRLVLENNF